MRRGKRGDVPVAVQDDATSVRSLEGNPVGNRLRDRRAIRAVICERLPDRPELRICFSPPIFGHVPGLGGTCRPSARPRLDQCRHHVLETGDPGERLRAGMSARIMLDLPDARKVIVLPNAAVVYSPYGNTVYVVTEVSDERGSTLIARQQFVELGGTRGSQVAILRGLQPGDQVVTSGQIKLRNGIPVQVNNTVMPSNDPMPSPRES